jgi:hypothetical protein
MAQRPREMRGACNGNFIPERLADETGLSTGPVAPLL